MIVFARLAQSRGNDRSPSPEALELVSTTGRDLDKGKGRARDAPPEDEDMSDNSSLEEESESDGAESEDVSMGDDEANKEFSESDVDQSLGITSGSLEFPSNWPSHSSASPNSDRQENVEMESMTGNRQEGSHDSSTTADTAGKRYRTIREPQAPVKRVRLSSTGKARREKTNWFDHRSRKGRYRRCTPTSRRSSDGEGWGLEKSTSKESNRSP